MQGAAHGAAHGAEHAAHHSVALEWGLMLAALAIAVIGIVVGLLLYVRRPELPSRITARLGGLYRVVANKYYVDEAYFTVIVRPIQNVSRAFLWKIVDVRIIDFLVNLVGIMSKAVSHFVRLMQTGYVQFYAAVILVGVVILLWVML